MSGICGIFSLNDQFVGKETSMIMMEKLRKNSIHKTGTWHDKHIFLGCHLQYVTQESKKEKLPFHYTNFDLAITADAIIDNRTELFKCLNIPFSEQSETTDSQLILLAYIRWGENCPKYLVGDFAFAIWDKRLKQLFCARDHVGKRTLYYHKSSESFAFCTLMRPLLGVSGNSISINEEWIADFLSIPTIGHEFDCTQTVYKGIFQLPPAHFMVIDQKGINIKNYWHPLNVSVLKLKSDAEYEEAFKEVFFEAVNCRTRSLKSVGIMLSGGIDSGSVACIAARKLKEEGKTLKAYSAVPMEGYKNWLPARFAADESPYIEAVRKFAGNIDVTYCRFEGKHPLTEVDKYLALLEQPYKAIENLFWLDEISERASKNGCSVLLDGQFGNASISYGDFFTYLYTLIKKLKFISAYSEITSYGSLHKVSRKNVSKYIAGMFLPYNMRKLLYGKRAGKPLNKPISPVNPEFSELFKVKERLRTAGFDPSPYKSCSFQESRALRVHPAAFSHLGAIETKLSLEYGIAKRDPTRDKRVIEFCMSLPEEQYVRGGQDRYLVRRAMAGYLPDKVRLNCTVKGRQSADWIQRLLPDWGSIQQEIQSVIQRDDLKPYIDTELLEEVLKGFNGSPPEPDQGLAVRMLLTAKVFGDFMKKAE